MLYILLCTDINLTLYFEFIKIDESNVSFPMKF